MPICGPNAEIASGWERERSAFSVSGLEAGKGLETEDRRHGRRSRGKADDPDRQPKGSTFSSSKCVMSLKAQKAGGRSSSTGRRAARSSAIVSSICCH